MDEEEEEGHMVVRPIPLPSPSLGVYIAFLSGRTGTPTYPSFSFLLVPRRCLGWLWPSLTTHVGSHGKQKDESREGGRRGKEVRVRCRDAQHGVISGRISGAGRRGMGSGNISVLFFPPFESNKCAKGCFEGQ